MTKAEVMAQKSKEEFDFEKDLSINKYKLDEECLSHSSLYFRYAEASILAKSELSKAKDNLELVESEANLRIRKRFQAEGQKVTESVIACTLAMDADVIKAKENVRECEQVFARLSVAVQSMETRRSELDNLVKLYCSGYFSTPTANNGAKKNINEQTANAVRKNLNDKE